MFSQVIYQLRLPGDCKFFTFKCSVNVTIKKQNKREVALYPYDTMIYHNDLTADMILEVCKNTEIKPKLTPLSGEELQGKTSNNSNETRIYIRTPGFWKHGNRYIFWFRLVSFGSYCLCILLPTANKF